MAKQACYIFLDSDTGSNESDIDALLDRPLQNQIPINIDEDNDDEENLELQPPYDVNKEILQYRNTTIKADTPWQLFSVCRSDGIEEMKADVLACYKNPRTNLTARPRVRFEDEEGIGAGPIREFLHNAVKLVEDGIATTSKPIIFFEGETDHKVPIHHPGLRQTGTFRAVGRILGHSFLHEGPALCGLAESVKHYLTLKDDEDISSNPPPLSIKDVPDIELQILLQQVLCTTYESKL